VRPARQEEGFSVARAVDGIVAIGQQEILLLVLIIVLLFGAAAIPKLARSLGRAQGEFQKARKDFEHELKAGRAESTPPTREEEERRIRAAARDLGIEEDGKPLDEVKRLLNERLA